MMREQLELCNPYLHVRKTAAAAAAAAWFDLSMRLAEYCTSAEYD
jgi:hypothetical protein